MSHGPSAALWENRQRVSRVTTPLGRGDARCAKPKQGEYQRGFSGNHAVLVVADSKEVLNRNPSWNAGLQ